MPFDMNILVGGEAGQGIQTIGFVLGKTFACSGLHVFADQDYESRIRGGHNFFRIRVGNNIVRAQSEKLDLLVAIDRKTIDLHRDALKDDGIVILDTQVLGIDPLSPNAFDIPLEKLAVAAGEKITVNSVAAGGVIGLIGGDLSQLEEVIKKQFAKHTSKLLDDNLKAVRLGYEYASQRRPVSFVQLPGSEPLDNTLFINGNEALSLGVVSGGCKFVAAYPMTPISSILEYLAEKARECEMVVIQPEDEIAAINMVVGASYAGVRAMTATSGSGFALMVEGIGLAGITETPAVIVLGQRPGPAVGLPTRTEQGELLFAIHVGSGEFPRVVFAPANVEDAFFLTAKAFNLAEKYQIPVIILTDTHLANSYTDTPAFNLDQIKIERGALLTNYIDSATLKYQRYALNDSGISPRAFPGQGSALVVADSDEHDEDGHLIESAEIRTRQNSKRLKKYDALKNEISYPRFITRPGAQVTLVGWGSTYGAILEASELLMEQGFPSNVLHITEIWPFPAEFVSRALKETSKNIVIELNAMAQLSYLIRAETGISVTSRINKWDGRPVDAQYIIAELKKVMI